MSSKRRIRRKSCQSKKRYSTMDEAYSALRQAIKREETFKGAMNVYPCKFCGGYHIGHISKIIKERV